jgi:uncharacterized protein YcsI (UPF0317 family)
MNTTEPARIAPSEARRRFREGLRTPTSGWCPGVTQANLIAVPHAHAFDLLLFTQRNARACPVIDVTDPGSHHSLLAPGADLRTDLPGYRIYRDGEFVDETDDVSAAWTSDLVAFLIGCSFTFEQALVEAGVPVRHREAGTNVPMYRTDQACRAAGRLRGPLVVSMRAIPAGLVATAVQVTARFPSMHGAPIHIGDPAGMGIQDIHQPDYGDAPVIEDGDVPVFWACGVTPQAAAVAAALPFAIAHAPGQMLITDVAEASWAVG